jgi:hypothetical protein
LLDGNLFHLASLKISPVDRFASGTKLGLDLIVTDWLGKLILILNRGFKSEDCIVFYPLEEYVDQAISTLHLLGWEVEMLIHLFSEVNHPPDGFRPGNIRFPHAREYGRFTLEGNPFNISPTTPVLEHLLSALPHCGTKAKEASKKYQ